MNIDIIIGFYFLGFASWTLLEYFIHRYLFHLQGNSSFSKRLAYVLHGVHHEFPRDKERLFMPPLPGFIILIFLLFFFYLFFQKNVFAFIPGLLNGYLVYSFLHFNMHTRRPPKFLKRLWSHHALHHYKQEEVAFGVSSRFWDWVFSTLPENDKRKVESRSLSLNNEDEVSIRVDSK
jgi:sterol desaturase/sphingolipid hydroxylase (fatty acid hydroxylase superfamily)